MLSTPLMLVPLPVTDYGLDARLSMSDRITKRGPAFVLGVLQHSMDALGRSIYFLNPDGVADSGQILHTIESASEDAMQAWRKKNSRAATLFGSAQDLIALATDWP